MGRSLIQDAGIINPLFYRKFGFLADVRPITADFVVTVNHPPLLIYDPNGASRDVLLPLASTAKGLMFYIVNSADANENLVIKDSTDVTTFNTIAQNGAGVAWCNGTTWFVYPLNSTLSASGVNATFSGTFNADGAATFGSTVGIVGLLSLTVMPKFPSATVAALGTNQGTAAAVTTGFTLVTAADDTVGVILPTAAAGLVCILKSSVSNKILKVYPFSGDAINALGANTVLSLASGPTSVILVAYDATTWYTIPLLPS